MGGLNRNTYAENPPGTWQWAAAITPSDAAALVDGNGNPIATVQIYVGTTGDLKVDLADSGGTVTFKSLPVGFWNIPATKVYSTGTTASNMLALW